MTAQLDMFCSCGRILDTPGRDVCLGCYCGQQDHEPATDAGNLTGLKVKLDRPVDRERPCCRNVCNIGPGKGPHAGELLCSGCGRHRGWLSKETAKWIAAVVSKFGAPTAPMIVRKAHTLEEEEAPPMRLCITKPISPDCAQGEIGHSHQRDRK